MNELDFRQRRRLGIGASDAGPICGCGFIDAETLFLQKLGLQESQPSDRMRMGILLEPVVAKLYEERMGCDVAVPAAFMVGEFDWQFANIDRISDADRIVELKCVFGSFGDEWGEPMSDDVPDGYFLQVQHQMGVSHLKEADVAALSVLTGELRVFRVEYDHGLYARLTDLEYEFWKKCLHRDFAHWERSRSEAIRKEIEKVRSGWRLDLGEKVEEFNSLVLAWETAKENAKEWDRQAKEMREVILAEMGECEQAQLSDGRVVKHTVSEVSERTQTVKAHARHDLKVLKGRKERS